MRPIYGIDLGTTYSKCAIVGPTDGQLRVFDLDKAVDDTRRIPILRSAVAVTVDTGRKVAFVGMQSLVKIEEWDEGDPPLRRFEESKIWIGQDLTKGGDAPPWPFEPHDWEYRPEDIGAIVLRKVQREVEADRGPAMSRVVVTHPQYFTDTQRYATRQAVEIAGLELVDTLTEPDAAAIAFGVDASPGKYMIFDLGGGTLDVTVAKIGGPHLEVLASDGLKRAGRDFDSLIFERMVRDYQVLYDGFDTAYLDDTTRQFWMRDAERVKRQLNDPEQKLAKIKFQCRNKAFPDGQERKLVVRREEFLTDAQPIIEDCVRCANSALENARLKWSELSGIICVGGSTRLLPLREALQRESGVELRTDVEPDTAIVRGAALYAHRIATRPAAIISVPTDAAAANAVRPSSAAAMAKDVRLIGVLARGLGVKALDAKQHRDVVVNLVKKGRQLPLPSGERKTFRTAEANKPTLEVILYEGEDSDPDLCEVLGKVELTGFPPGPAGQPVDVLIEIDGNGTKHLVVSAFGQRSEAMIQFDPARVVHADDIARRRDFIASLVVL